jgi:hypothetical protein
MRTKIETHLPEALLQQAQAYVDEGWAEGLDELLTEALRRYLEPRLPSLAETFLREDVEWGLRGRD